MKKFTNILFDFDGTLFDTSEGIFNSMQKVCNHYNLNYHEDTFRKMIGPSLNESFSTIFHLPKSEIQNAINIYREYYSTEGMYQCTPYPQIVELIKALKEDGRQIFIATSKPEIYTKQILEKKDLLKLFNFTGGADLTEQIRCEKVDVINYVLKENHLENQKDSCLMIGDRNYDIKGAHLAGLKALGILWGFGSRQEFEKANADFILEKPEELLAFLTE